MRGEILNFESDSGTGVIAGNDGQRYTFARASFQLPTAPAVGQRVDFEAERGEAVRILVVAPSAAADRYGSQDYGDRPFGAEEPANAFGTRDTAHTGYAPVPSGIQTGFDWQKVFLSFNGRIRRSHFWIAWGILFAASLVLGFIPIIGTLISLVLIWPSIAIQVTRLHDMGKTGWLVVVPWVANIVGIIAIISTVGLAAIANSGDLDSDDPAQMMAVMGPAFGIIGLLVLVGLGFLLWIGISDSQPGPNKYGPNPKDHNAGTTDTFA